jgi:hypothetical protein
MSAPERISLLPDDGWSWCEGAPVHEENRIEYVRADLHEALRAERDALKERVERLAQEVFDRIGERIEAQAQDGISAEGVFSETVQGHQRQFVDGMRLARLLAVNTIRAAISTQETTTALASPDTPPDSP